MSAIVKIGFDGGEVQQGLSLLESRFGKFKQSMGTLLGASGIGGIFAAVGGTAMIKNTMDELTRLADLALRFDASVEAMQRLKLVAGLAGADVETVARALTVLSKALDDPSNKKAADAFERLGLSLAALKSANPFDQIKMLSAAFQRAQASGTGFADILALLGKSGAELVPLLRMNKVEMENLAGMAVVSDDNVKKIEELSDRLEVLQSRLYVLVGSGVAESADAVTLLFEQVSEAAANFQESFKPSDAAGFGFNALRGDVVGLTKDIYRMIFAKDAFDRAAWRSMTKEVREGGGGGKSAAPLVEPPPAPVAGGLDTAETARQFAEVEKLRAQYGQLQFDALQRNAPLEMQISNLKKLQAQRAAEFQTILEQGPQTEETLLRYQIENHKIQQEINGLVKQEESLKSLAAEATRKEQEQRQKALADIQMEFAILQARSQGETERVALLEKEQRIQEKMLSIKEQLNLSGEDALKMARAMIDLEDKAAKKDADTQDREGSGGQKIRGLNSEVHARAMEKWRSSGLDGYKAQLRSGQRLSETFTFPGLEAGKRMQERGADGKRLIPVGNLFEAEQRRSREGEGHALQGEIKDVLLRVEGHLERIAVD